MNHQNYDLARQILEDILLEEFGWDKESVKYAEESAIRDTGLDELDIEELLLSVNEKYRLRDSEGRGVNYILEEIGIERGLYSRESVLNVMSYRTLVDYLAESLDFSMPKIS